MKQAIVLSCLGVVCVALGACDPEPLNPRPFPDLSASADMDASPDLTTDQPQADMSGDVSSDLSKDMSADASRDTSADLPDMAMDESVDLDQPVDMPVMARSAGCLTGQGLAEGEHTFMLENRSRKYVVRLPKNYTRDKAWPLVLALHGNGGDTSYWDGTSGGRNIRKVLEDDAILIVALAIDKQWRDYSMPAETRPARIESELLYFEEVISQAKSELCINTDTIFSMGFSGGGSFSGVLGCRRTDIRAFAAGGAVIYFDENKCVNHPAAWITIGKKELEGREPFRNFFRDRAMCQEAAQDTSPSPCVAYNGCDADTPVHYCEHPDGHIWPDFGSQAMWDFFKQFK